MAEEPVGVWRRRRGLVFTVLLCVWLILMVLCWAALLVEEWDNQTRSVMVMLASLYFSALAALLLGVYLPGQGRRRSAVRRALVMVPVGVAGCVLAVATGLALSELGPLVWRWSFNDFMVFVEENPVVCLLAGCVPGAALAVVTWRVPLDRLFKRCWLALALASGATSAVAFHAHGVCAARGGWLPGLEAAFAMLTAWIVLSWAIAFGLAVGATRDRNAAPLPRPDAPEPPRAER